MFKVCHEIRRNGGTFKLFQQKSSTLIPEQVSDFLFDVPRTCPNDKVLQSPSCNIKICRKHNEHPQITSIARMLRSCSDPKALKEGIQIHQQVVNYGLIQNRFIGNLLVQMYGRCGALGNALEVFNNMVYRNSFSWNIMISACVHAGKVIEAIRLFKEMPQPDVVSYNTMLAAYAKSGQLEAALELFKKMPFRDVVSWNAMIAAYIQNRDLKEAMKLFTLMPRKDVVSWTTVVAAHAQLGQFDLALELFHQMPERDTVSWTAVLALYAQSGQLGKAMDFFNNMQTRDVVAWNALIAGYSQHGKLDQALRLFKQMQLEGFRPDKSTFVSIFSMCAQGAALTEGKWAHTLSLCSEFAFDVIMGNALIDMYGKCGCLDEASRVFDNLTQRDLISWNTIIAAYSQYGHPTEALKVFQAMLLQGILPHTATFVSAFCACLLDEGFFYLLLMAGNCKLTPTLEHFTCRVTDLGQAGWLDESSDLISNMPPNPDVTLWTSLLRSCSLYMDTLQGKYAAEHVFNLDPKDAAIYASLSNIYAASLS